MVKNNEYVNKRNVKLIKVLNKTRVLVECPLCGSVLEMWKGHFYRGSNSCTGKENWIKEQLNKGVPKTEIAKALKIDRSTLWRYIRKGRV